MPPPLRPPAHSLMRRAPCSRAELHKLNIYTTGGHFQRHCDTPRSELQFGSLVIALPVGFTGGSLSCFHKQQTECLDWAAGTNAGTFHAFSWASAERQAAEKRQAAERQLDHVVPNKLKWAAFFGDVEHAVAPVSVYVYPRVAGCPTHC